MGAREPGAYGDAPASCVRRTSELRHRCWGARSTRRRVDRHVEQPVTGPWQRPYGAAAPSSASSQCPGWIGADVVSAGETEQMEAPLVPPPLERVFDQASVQTAVQENDLEQIGVRPRLIPYFQQLWQRRSFIQVLASSKAEAENQNTYLGQIWALVSPTINASVYVLIFGFLLNVGRAGIENTIAFIVVGVFMFRFFERSVMAGAHSLNKNMNLVRSVQFPRAVLPAAGVLAELMILGPAIVVMCVISYASGFLPMSGRVTIDAYWLLLLPAIFLLWLFS